MKKFMLILCALFLSANAGCAKREEAAIKIGGIEITAGEFEAALEMSQFAGKGEAGRREFLDHLISRKLILREAERMGLDKDAEFLQSIQLFWEQSLLKLALAHKIKELTARVNVDDREIADYFHKRKEDEFVGKELSAAYEGIKLLLFRQKQAAALEDWITGLRNKAGVEIDYPLLGIENK